MIVTKEAYLKRLNEEFDALRKELYAPNPKTK